MHCPSYHSWLRIGLSAVLHERWLTRSNSAVRPLITPAKRALAQSSVFKDLNSKDTKTLASVVQNLTSIIQQDANDPDLYLLRATVSCQINGNKDGILRDIETSVRLWTPGSGSAYDSLRDHYTLKAKVEFDAGRYQEAMSDLDESIRLNYASAEQVFNDGNVKPNQPTVTPCVWTQNNLTTLSRLFPKDYRTSVYIGLYLRFHASFDLDADYQPIMQAFTRAAELNLSSALPFYFSADPYVVGGIGGLMSKGSSTCIDDVVPRTPACLALDETHRTGVRFLTRAIAADSSFAPAYELRAIALFQLRESRQAIRDYNKVLELNPKANVYNDRALAEMDLHEYQAAIRDYTKAIAQGCDTSMCFSYENRANAYLKVHDYTHAISDISETIKNVLSGTIFGFNIEQFRRIYPEYDDVPDDVLCEKLRVLFNPQMSYAVYSKQFLVDAKEFDDFVLPELFLKRGDAYADMGDPIKASREYDRVSGGYPKWAEHSFTTRNGKRVRIRQ